MLCKAIMFLMSPWTLNFQSGIPFSKNLYYLQWKVAIFEIIILKINSKNHTSNLAMDGWSFWKRPTNIKIKGKTNRKYMAMEYWHF
jgi:hypothetical protein